MVDQNQKQTYGNQIYWIATAQLFDGYWSTVWDLFCIADLFSACQCSSV